MKTFTNLIKRASLSTFNKKRYYLFIIMLLTLGIGTAWAEEELYKTALFGSSYNSKKVSSYTDTWTATNNGFTVTVVNANNNNNGWAYIKMGRKSNLSVGSITTEQAIDKPISKITMTIDAVTANNINSIKLKTSINGSSFAEAGTFTIAKGDQSVTINNPTANLYYQIEVDCKTGSNGSIQISKVQYYATEDAGSGGDEPVTPTSSLTATPTTIDFGTVYQGTTVESKTIVVNFENLTDNVTYSGLSSPFTATGTVSATGDKITIAADASTIGDNTQTLTITSAADSKTAEVTVKMNVVEKPAPTGTFTLHTGALVEGDYVIYYSGKAMKAAVSSNRLGYEEVTPSGNDIVDPLASTIWHIAPSGSNWTIYNETAGYAAGNGTKNQAALLANLDGDNAKKATWTLTGTDTYDFTNVWNTEKGVNAILRNNGTYGYACYAGSTGGALSLYRKAGTKYNVTVSATTNGTVTANPTSAEAGATITLTVTPEAGYVLDALTVTDASSNTVTVTNNEFTMPASDVTVTATFKENEKPAATLTLSKNGVTEDITGNKQDDVITLPSTVDTDCVKQFVGWSADANCAIEPEYAPGASYTLASTSQTLYAVYATVEGGETTVSVDMATYATDNSWGSSSSINQKEININSDVKAVISEGGNSGKYYNDGVRIYQTEDATVTISTTAGELKSVKFTFTIANNGTLLHEGVVMTSDEAVEVSGTSAVFSVGDTHATENKGQVRFTAIEVVYTGGATYSNYSTTCSAALANPIFSLTEGKYTEAKSVEIEYTEGTVYYTLDGTTPTASSTQYTGAIALNDCGEYTIKAIAISSDSQSDVVSATYTIKLPLTNSQSAPYTETEAIAVYDGDCYDNQDVYVKGTVKTATFYSSGTYTITLTNGFQFYKFYKDGSNATFTDGEINVGDVLVACGKLSKYNTTYQLAEGCYLVEHTPYEGEKTDISNTEATAYTVDQAFALIADPSSDLTKEVYVKGLVAVAPTSNPTADGQMTYKISDNGENTGNVLTVYLGLNLNGEKFTSKEDVKLGDYVVVKGQLYDYNSTYELNKGNQLVEHIPAATITIEDITMEVDETKTIAATITPAAAETAVVYTIKENTDNAISLTGNTITAIAVGTATITATIATAAEYMGKTVDFTVTVNAKSTKEKVVILAQYEGQWYAMMAQYVSGKTSHLAALPVTYFEGKLYNVDEEYKALIEWERAVVDDKATFKNGSNYLTGKSGKTDLTLATTAYNWTIDGDSYLTGDRTFLYNAENNWFRHFGISNAGDKNYSGMPTVTAPVYTTGDVTYTRATTAGKFGTICLPFGSTNYTGAEFFEFVGSETGKVYIGSVDELVAGVPYIFLASAAKVVVTSDGTTAATPGDSNGLYGTFTDNTEVAVGNYILKDNALCQAEAICWVNAYRAYIVMSEVPTGVPQQMPGRRYISMSTQGENAETGLENIIVPEDQAVKVISNGQLIIIRDGEMYNAQGQKL